MINKIRKNAFWALDKLRGSRIKHHFESISLILGGKSEVVSSHIESKISELIKHAVKSTDFYRSFDKEAKITDLPVVNKNIIREYFEAFRSTNIHSKDTISVVTSGSTGTPFEILHDMDKRYRNTADTLYFSKLAGFKIGERLYYMKIWNNLNRKSAIISYAQNIKPVNVFDLSDYSIEKMIYEFDNSKGEIHLLGYASVYDEIVRYLDDNNVGKLNVNVKSIIAMSENLSDYTKDQMSFYFGAPTVSRYSNIENGILAQQLRNDDRFLINQASYFIEILQIEDDLPVENGELGRIVVTDFYNKAMPMIRYDTGDLGVMENEMVNEVPVLFFKKVEGRKMDQIFNTSGKLISSYIITNNMWKYKNIKQYQFIQLSKVYYKIKINVNDSFERKEELIREFTEYFGKDANIEIEYVDEIPLLSSGKRKKVINMLNS